MPGYQFDSSDPFNTTSMDFSGFVQYLPMTDSWIYGTDSSVHALELLAKEQAAFGDSGVGGGGSGGPKTDASSFHGMSMDDVAAKNRSMTPAEREAYWNGNGAGKNVSATQGTPSTATPPITTPSGYFRSLMDFLNGVKSDAQAIHDVATDSRSISEQAGNGPGILGLPYTTLIVIVAGLILLAVAAKSVVAVK